MKDITILIPFYNKEHLSMLENTINNINSITYSNDIYVKVIIPKDMDLPMIKGWDNNKHSFVINKGETDYCSQINCGVKDVNTNYFSIMEVDDEYNVKWFNMCNNYFDEDISIYLPINVVNNLKTQSYEFVNHIAWSTGFTSNEDNADLAQVDNVGYITFNSLQDTASFNLTGGIFKTSDWLGYKPSIKVAFNYEYLLRATSKKQKIFVIPKEGYYHSIFRENSLSEIYLNEISEKDVIKWYELAKREYSYDNDRQSNIIENKTEILK